ALSSPVSLTHPLSRTQARRCALYRRLALKLVVALCVVSRRLQKQTESASDPLAGGSCGLLASARLVSFLQSVGPWAGFCLFTQTRRIRPTEKKELVCRGASPHLFVSAPAAVLLMLL
ncbi:hypothetical protein S83_042013, partial [Arachis hypogaea]